MLYLIHETADGFPIGVFSADGTSYYDPNYAAAHEAYGKKIVDSQSSGTWDDWVNTLDSRLPNHRSQFIGVDLPTTPLQDILLDQQTQYNQDDLNS